MNDVFGSLQYECVVERLVIKCPHSLNLLGGRLGIVGIEIRMNLEIPHSAIDHDRTTPAFGPELKVGLNRSTCLWIKVDLVLVENVTPVVRGKEAVAHGWTNVDTGIGRIKGKCFGVGLVNDIPGSSNHRHSHDPAPYVHAMRRSLVIQRQK